MVFSTVFPWVSGIKGNPVKEVMFKLNDSVVYPGHGVAVVEEIIEKNFSGSAIQFLKLTFLFKDMTILVPMYNIVNTGIRYPESPETIQEIIEELSKKSEKKFESIDFTPSGWNRRNKDYQLRMQSGKLLEIAKIYRDIMHISQQKDLSFGERTLLQSVEELLVQELLVVTKKDRELVVQMLRNPFKQFLFHDASFAQEGATPAI
jgi:CarD family transcriptional regulator